VLDLNVLGLLAYIIVSGLRSTVLKGLQIRGAEHPIGGENPISFCNVFLISQSVVGLSIVLSDGRRSFTDINKLDRHGRWLIAADAFFGCFLAPMSFSWRLINCLLSPRLCSFRCHFRLLQRLLFCG
jgi:hypothetical protein